VLSAARGAADELSDLDMGLGEERLHGLLEASGARVETRDPALPGIDGMGEDAI
jgi:hypothetical protein